MHCRKTAPAHQAQIAMAVVVATNSVAHAQDPARAAVADTVKYVFFAKTPLCNKRQDQRRVNCVFAHSDNGS